MERMACLILSVFAVIGLVACGNGQTSKSVENDILADASISSITEPSPSFVEDEDKVIAGLNFLISEKDFDKNKDKYLADIRGNYDYEIDISIEKTSLEE